MGWLRELFDRSPRRGHRHAPVAVDTAVIAVAGAVATVGDDLAPGWSSAVETTAAYGSPGPAATAPPLPAGSLEPPSPQVTLGFRDGSEAHLAPLDPRMRAFLTVADTLRRSES